MDSKADEFLGASPLLFAVNAIDDDNHRSVLFDSFLLAVSSSAAADIEPNQKKQISLFRPDGEDYSSDEDDGFQDFLNNPNASNTSHHHPQRSTFSYLGGSRPRPAQDDATEHETAYVKSRTMQGAGNFFERARILSVSERYGLPPSKDPEGSQNLAHEVATAYKRRLADCVQHITLAFERYPMLGIMPSGWLEKHKHALPSVIMVVCTLSTSQTQQAEQDRRLFSVVEHLQYSLVPKRQCSVQIIGIMTDGVSDAQGQDWSQAIYQDIVMEQQETTNTPIAITLLRASSDLMSDQHPTTPALQKLHKSMEDASLLYYLRQARRTKEKLLKLVEDKKRKGTVPIQLSPLIIRYCCKVAVFYEFQRKHEKCIRFLIIAYRQTIKYYKYLREQPVMTNVEPQSPPRASSPLTIGVSGDSVEMELGSPGERGIVWSEVVSAPPEDILHQCRGVAEWLNAMLLVSGFSSQTEGGIVASANQWRLHTKHFASPPRRITADSWWDWLYIARQRSTISTLMERYPPKALSDAEYEEVMLRCSSWRAYESTAEAMLHLNRALSKAQKDSLDDSQTPSSDGLRNRYLGGFSSELLRKELMLQLETNHLEKALDLVMKAKSNFEQEQERLKLGFYAEDEFSERLSRRTGARLYYLAGGILLGMEKHEDSAIHLSKASRYAAGWPELELSIRRMLISCYEKHIPTEDNTSSENLASMILDSYFNAEMSSQDLRKALGHFAAVTGGDALQWRHVAKDDEDESLPLSFSVNFPGKTHATSGDTVVAAVTIKSNLDYAIHVTSATLKTLAGEIEIPTNDLLAAKNASEGTGGIIVQAKSSILVSTMIELPKDVSMIAFDESGNGGELQGTAGKGAFAKNAKPRSAGVTSAGGARLASEDKLKVGNANSQGWNLQCLGGKPLLCDGLKLRFYPVQAERTTGGSDQLTIIELVVDKKKSRTAANIRRTPFEEENYVSSAWSRPQNVSFKLGPRSIRVLGPEPGLVISDISTNATKGHALDGTVNRVLLQLEADMGESCENIEISATCFSVLIAPTGTTKRLVSEEELMSPETESSLNMTDGRWRTPVLVEETESSDKLQRVNGFELPGGWKACGSGQKKATTISSLQRGQATRYAMDFYRPSAVQLGDPASEGDHGEERLGELSICKTDFYLTIKYKQIRHRDTKAPVKRTRKRPSRRKPVMPSKAPNDNENTPPIETTTSLQDEPEGDDYEDVSLEYSGSICWVNPLVAIFQKGHDECTPSHVEATGENCDQRNPFVVISGSRLPLRCTLSSSIPNLQTEVLSVSFQESMDMRIFSLSSATGNSSQIYQADENNPSSILSSGSSVLASYSLLVSLPKNVEADSVASSAGKLVVEWRPISLSADIGNLENGTSYGPLVLKQPVRSVFLGPTCLVERAPFGVGPIEVSPNPKVGEPFTGSCSVINRTHLHQTVEVSVEMDKLHSDLLASGMGGGSLSLSPGCRGVLYFTLIGMKAGEILLPKLQVSAARYGTNVFDNEQSDRTVFISP